MFSSTPRMGIFAFLNMATARRASIRARSCGVETITAPASGVAPVIRVAPATGAALAAAAEPPVN